MMSKEHFVESYGVPVYTVSQGCSGGSYGSSQLVDRIPELFQGILIACTFPDPLGIAFSGSDGHLLTHYFTVTDPAGFTDAQQVAVSGYKGHQAWYDAANQSGRTDPVPGRVDVAGYASAVWNPAVPVALRYDPVTNPGGARPTVYDHNRNMYGVNPITGFALRPFDNVGVQYGLGALNAGVITTTQFLNLNEKIGGYDQDANYVPNRVVGDLGAIKRAQQSGLQLGGNGGLASIPVFDISGIYNDDGGYHYEWYHFAMRERMAQANGNAANHVMWRGNPVRSQPPGPHSSRGWRRSTRIRPIFRRVTRSFRISPQGRSMDVGRSRRSSSPSRRPSAGCLTRSATRCSRRSHSRVMLPEGRSRRISSSASSSQST